MREVKTILDSVTSVELHGSVWRACDMPVVNETVKYHNVVWPAEARQLRRSAKRNAHAVSLLNSMKKHIILNNYTIATS